MHGGPTSEGREEGTRIMLPGALSVFRTTNRCLSEEEVKGVTAMNSSLIGKIEKARRYAAEPERAEIRSLYVRFRGDHDVYDVRFEGGTWTCTCHSFEALGVGTCSHIMALERLLGPLTPHPAGQIEQTV